MKKIARFFGLSMWKKGAAINQNGERLQVAQALGRSSEESMWLAVSKYMWVNCQVGN